jgi:hypothetical protein
VGADQLEGLSVYHHHHSHYLGDSMRKVRATEVEAGERVYQPAAGPVDQRLLDLGSSGQR